MLICNKCRKEITKTELTELEEEIKLLLQDYDKDYCNDCIKKLTLFLLEDYDIIKTEDLLEFNTFKEKKLKEEVKINEIKEKEAIL